MIKRFLMGVFIFIILGVSIFAEEIETEEEEISAVAESVLKLGTHIGKSIAKDGYNFTVESMYTDEDVFYTVCSIEKIDGSCFEKSKDVLFWNHDITDDIDGGVGIQCCQQCHIKKSSEKKIYFLLEGRDYFERTEESKGKVCMKMLMQQYEMQEECAIDLVSYLEKNKEPKLKSEKLMLPNGSYDPNIDVVTLAERNLNMSVIKGNDKYTLKNMGFVNGKLHLVIDSKEETLHKEKIEICFMDKEGEIYTAFQENHCDREGYQEEYCMYAITDLKTLKQYKCYVQVYGANLLAEGPYEVDIPLDQTVTCISKKPDEMITYEDQKQGKLKELTLKPSGIVIQLAYSEGWNSRDSLSVDLKMKDGSTIYLEYGGSDFKEKNERVFFTMPMFSESAGLIDINQVESITIGGKTFKIK